MIEFCTKKRMGIAILALIFLSVIVLFIENNMSLEPNSRDTTRPPENDSQECGIGQELTVVKECRACNSLEKKVQPKCLSSGYLELIRCSGSDLETYRSCPKMSWLEEKNFWVFEAVTAVIGLGSYSLVYLRQKTLDRLLLEKVNKQIAAGV